MTTIAGTTTGGREATIRLDDLAEAILLYPDSSALGGTLVRRVRPAHRVSDLEHGLPGDVVVLDPGLDADTAGYRFDLALRRAPDGLAAVVCHDVGPTGRRIAAQRGIALATLSADHDIASLAELLMDLGRGGLQTEVNRLGRLCKLTDECESVDEVNALLVRASNTLGQAVDLVDKPTAEEDHPIRVQGRVQRYLHVDGPPPSAITQAAISHLARRIESLLQAEFDARELQEAARSELINEILISEAGTSADAAGRLRRAHFPIDGSHCAIRIDCRSQPGTDSSVSSDAYRAQLQLADAALAAVRRTPGIWTRAGTAASIVLISSRTTSHGDLVSREVSDAAKQAMDAAGALSTGLVVHVGVGNPHLGQAGLRTTVQEATTAVRSARDRGRPYEVHHFDRIGFSRALLQWAELDGVRDVVDEILGPVLRQSKNGARESLDTLRAYLESGRNASVTAERLHLHRNTVRYRIERIKQQLPVDLDDPDERLLVELGCRLAALER